MALDRKIIAQQKAETQKYALKSMVLFAAGLIQQ
jgi:hypothetical protein